MFTGLKRSALNLVRAMGYEIRKIPQPEDTDVAPPVQAETVDAAVPPIPDHELYLKLYGIDTFERRPFLNIGAGSFHHPAWRNVDFSTEAYEADVTGNVDIPHDLSEMKPLPIEDESIEAVFTSHTVEHIQDQHDAFLFRDVFRVLKPGGYFRITCPDIELYFRAYKRGDRDFFPSYGDWYIDEPIEQIFLREIATQISTANNDGLPIEKVSAKEVRETFDRLPLEDALNSFTRRIEYKRWYKTAPGNHVNWWTYEKMFRFLQAANFTRYYRSGKGQSECPVMRRVPLFDSSAWPLSLYVEAQKTT